MKLSRIEDEIAPVILNRGRAYHEEGCVQYFEEVRPGVYEAQVDGSEEYDIKIRLVQEGLVTFTSCDCPFDGPICKHVVAVLLELREELANAAERPSSEGEIPGGIRLSDALTKLSKEELIDLLLQFANDMKEVDQRLRLKFQDAGSEASMKQYQKIIRTSIKKSADRHGFVAYRFVSDAVEGAELVMKKAYEQLEDGHILSAVQISLCLMTELLDLLQACDDSDGIVGGMMESCLDIIVAVSEHPDIQRHADRAAVLLTLLKASSLKELEDWEDWQLSLMGAGKALIQNQLERSAWEQELNQLERAHSTSTYSSYFKETAAQLRHDVIRRFDGEEAAAAFMQSLLHMSGFRKIAIEQALANHEWDQARRLIEEGEKVDTKAGYPGLVNNWRKFRYKLYQLTGQMDEQRKLAEEFAVSGDHDFYLELRQLYTVEEWLAVNEGILTALDPPKARGWKADALYLQILTEQRDTKRLLAYVRYNPSSLAELSSHLLGEHREEVHQLFVQYIESEAMVANNRSQYTRVCQIIRQLVKAEGSEKALAVVTKLRMTYTKRSAFLDELRQVKVQG
jgi:hypothetical protein